MFHQFFSRLYFLLTSTNQHGVHSPFVFDFVTKGLYQKNVDVNKINQYQEFKNLSSKKKKILSKILSYFNVKTVFTDVVKANQLSKKQWNVLFLNELKNEHFLIPSPNYFVVINDIHKSKMTFGRWKYLLRNRKATVSIDLFYYGLIFFREEQAKEHFKIRV